MNFKKTQLAVTLSLLLHFPTLISAQNTHYEAGHESMHKQQYEKAYEQFKEAESDQNYTDSSLYWQSYALFKVNQDAVARRTLEKLFSDYPKSRWIDDAKVLALEHGVEKNRLKPLDKGAEKTMKEAQLDEELRLFAIQQVMFKDSSKGLALVKELLGQSTNHQIKLNALQLLGIVDSDEATRYLYDFVDKNDQSVGQGDQQKIIMQAQDLKRQAIQMLGIRNSKESHKMLQKLYEKNPDKHIKSSIIDSFIHQNNNKQLMKMLAKEKDHELNEQMIRLLGVMGAREELRELAKASAKEQHKKALLDAMALSGDVESIKSMIESSEIQQEKIDAINSLVILNDENVQEYLSTLYEDVDEQQIKEEIINVFIATDTDAEVIEKLIEKEQNDVIKARLIDSLMVMDDKKTLMHLLDSESNLGHRHDIINALGVMGAGNELQIIFNDHKDNKTRHQILEAIAFNGTSGRESFYYQAYKDGDEQIKQAVINAFMISENTSALIHLLKLEKSPSLKKSLIQTIGMTDPDYFLKKIEAQHNKGEQ